MPFYDIYSKQTILKLFLNSFLLLIMLKIKLIIIIMVSMRSFSNNLVMKFYAFFFILMDKKHQFIPPIIVDIFL